MSTSIDLLVPQPGSLIAEAFEAADGSGRHESLERFVAHCMANGSFSGDMPRCLRGATLQGPELIALESVRRIVGVGPRTEISEDHDAFYGNVERIEERVANGHQPAPFILELRDDGWRYLLDGNHTKMALKRLGITRWWGITLMPDASCEPGVAEAA